MVSKIIIKVEVSVIGWTVGWFSELFVGFQPKKNQMLSTIYNSLSISNKNRKKKRVSWITK